MAKKGRIERNERVKAPSLAQAEKRSRLKQRQLQIFNSYSAKLAKENNEDKKKEILQKASMELFQISVVFQKLKRDGSKTRIRNRCAITGRPRGFYGLFGLSRNTIRESASFGLIMGLRKSSW